jgi:DNA-directed RNA polymerase subunit RPC12/RpoP
LSRPFNQLREGTVEDGFECPACGGRQYSLVTTRDLYQCTKCRRQTSPIAGTIFASTHLPLLIRLGHAK